jgi:hypothetical protein
VVAMAWGGMGGHMGGVQAAVGGQAASLGGSARQEQAQAQQYVLGLQVGGTSYHFGRADLLTKNIAGRREGNVIIRLISYPLHQSQIH